MTSLEVNVYTERNDLGRIRISVIRNRFLCGKLLLFYDFITSRIRTIRLLLRAVIES